MIQLTDRPHGGEAMMTDSNTLGQMIKWVSVAGVGGLIAVFLTWFQATTIDAKLNESIRVGQEVNILMGAHVAAMDRHLVQDATDSRMMKFYLWRICYNTAKNDTDRKSCVTAEP